MRASLTLFTLLLSALAAHAQEPHTGYHDKTHMVFSAENTPPPYANESLRLEQLQRKFVDLRFGMFICYGLMTHGARWGQDNYPLNEVNPQKLDCKQWADAAVSANMKFGLLTTKHHEGLCLWDSKFTDYDIASTPYKKDIVRQYVDAFREKGLRIGLYYTIGDNTRGIKRDKKVTKQDIEYLKGQITELLTNYGEIDYFVTDSWWWSVGHHDVPYNEIRSLIRKLQPNCLLSDHTHLQAVHHLDIPYFEGPFGARPTEDNIMPSAIGDCVFRGNGWFWNEKTDQEVNLDLCVKKIVRKLGQFEQRYCNYMLNCMPNSDGLLGDNYIELLKKIGKSWQPDPTRPPLPSQGPQFVFPLLAVDATATSGDPMAAIDAKMIGGKYTTWETDKSLPQSITLDLGNTYSGVEMLAYVPAHKMKPERSLKEGNIASYRVFAGENNEDLRLIAEGQWNADGKMKKAVFKAVTERFFRLDVLEADSGYVMADAIEVGAFSKAPIRIDKEK